MKDITLKKANTINWEEPETDERDKIENTTKLNLSKIQEPRGNDDLVDNDTDLEHVPVHDTKEVANKINKNLLLWLLITNKIKKWMIRVEFR